MMAIPLLIYWALAFWGLFARGPVLLYLLVMSIPFGSFAVLPPQLTGGLTFVPATMTGLLICLRQFLLHRSGLPFLAASVTRLDRGLLLFLFWVVALLATIASPRIFAGEILVVPVRAIRSGLFLLPDWLRPTTQNVSQMAYLTVSVALTFALGHLLRRPGGAEALARAWIWGGGVTVATGALDLMSQYLPLAPLLAPFRTATYTLMTDNLLKDGAKRVVGLMPEASAYGSICLLFLTFLWFLRHALPDAARRRAMPLCALLLLFTILSTSSAAYVGLGVLAALAALEWLWRASGLEALRSARRGVRIELLVAVGAVAAFAVLLIAAPATLDPVTARIETMVFDKVDSNSYEERSAWTRISFEAGLSSYLMGVGVGSTRASNVLVAVFSNTGLLGFLLYYAFVIQCMTRPIGAGATPLGRGMLRAARWSFIPGLVIGALAGTSADFGVTGAIRWAIVLAVCAAPTARRSSPAALPTAGAS